MEFIQDRELHNAYFRKHVVDAVTADEVKARYDKEVAALPQEEEIKAAHILVASEDEAKDVIKQLDSGKDFAALAKEKSTDSNKDDGGDLGWFGKGRMVPEFEEAAFGLEKGAYTKAPVKTSSASTSSSWKTSASLRRRLSSRSSRRFVSLSCVTSTLPSSRRQRLTRRSKSWMRR